MELLHSDITDDILKTFFHVYNLLGYGFLEKVYENAMVIALKQTKYSLKQQHPIKVYFEENLIGEYFADLLIDDKVIVELKASETIAKEHEAQLLNYLKATQIEVGLLLNFGRKPEFKRRVFSNPNK
ncbi:MAG: GxxExxY protein [Ignavibacteriales bacterium]|nr:GxxExxY protein [Ignavibacteriales bacterium]